MVRWMSSTVRDGSSRGTRAGAAVTVACGFVLALPFMAGSAAAAPASSGPAASSAGPAHQQVAAGRPGTRAPLGAAPAVPLATPVHTFHPVASAPDEPQDPAFLGSGTCSSTPSGVCTLRAAVMEANAEGAYIAIVLTSGTYHLTIPPAGTFDSATGNLDITDPGTVTITGAGPTHTFIDGSGMSTGPGTGDRIFSLDGSAVVHMTGLTIQHGSAAGDSSTNSDPGSGGGIDIYSRAAALVLQSVHVNDNSAVPPTSQGEGGGMYVNGALWARDSQIDGNAAASFGGGMYLNQGSVQFVNVSVDHNTVANSQFGNYFGGGIFNEYGPLSMQGGSVSANHVVVDNGYNGYGGGLYVDDATTLVGTTIADNTVAFVSGATSGRAQGGGIFEQYGLNRADHLTIRGNSALGTVGNSGCCGDGGGGIYDYYGMTLTHSVVTGNHTTGNGGGIFNYGDIEQLSRVAVSNNTAAGDGGGVYGYDTTYVSQSSITGNTATGDGGGFWSDDGQQLDQTLISRNSALQGGGFWNSGTAQLTNDTLTGNRASGSGSAGGAFYNSPGGASGQFTNITISGNRSDDGGGIFDGGDSINGITVHNSIIAGNKDLAGSTDTNCDVSQNGAVPLTDAGYNLDSGHTCALAGPGDKSGVNPKLGALANNGGPTKTEALLTGSPAINAGHSPAPSVDQRNVKRDSRPDMGAFERK